MTPTDDQLFPVEVAAPGATPQFVELAQVQYIAVQSATKTLASNWRLKLFDDPVWYDIPAEIGRSIASRIYWKSAWHYRVGYKRWPGREEDRRQSNWYIVGIEHQDIDVDDFAEAVVYYRHKERSCYPVPVMRQRMLAYGVIGGCDAL